MKKRIVVLLLTLCLVAGSLSASVLASGYVLSGECGNNIKWTYDTMTKVLTIDGTGKMWNLDADELAYGYTYFDSDVYNAEYLRINEGITHIGSRAFLRCSDLKIVEIAKSVESIGEYAFSSNCPWINDKINAGSDVIVNNIFIRSAKTGEIKIEAPIKIVLGGAIENATSVTFGESVETIGDEAVREDRNPELKSVTVLNPECEFVLGAIGITKVWNHSEGATTYVLPGLAIYGYPNSTAQAYCEEQNTTYKSELGDNPWKFIALEGEPENPSTPTPFTDVPSGSFYEVPVIWAVENDITTGATATTFNPTGECLRAHAVTFLHRADGNPAPTSTKNPFTDVKSSDFFYKPVLWAVEQGITNGTSATKFGSYDVCNRAAVVTFLWRAAGSPTPNLYGHPFTDVPDGAFYENAVLWALENGITQGISATKFGPTDPCNRAQVVTFLYRAYN